MHPIARTKPKAAPLIPYFTFSYQQIPLTLCISGLTLPKENTIGTGASPPDVYIITVLVKALFLACRLLPSHPVLAWQRWRERVSSLVSLLIKALIPL